MNQFIRRKALAQPLSTRELKRRQRPTVRQQRRVIQHLKADASRRIREDLDERLADQGIDKPSD